MSLLGGVGNYIGNVAREVRDIPTAIATNISAGMNGGAASYGNKSPLNTAGSSNLGRQLSEVGGALIGHTNGTRSDQFNSKTNTYTSPANNTVSSVNPSAGTMTPINRASSPARVPSIPSSSVGMGGR